MAQKIDPNAPSKDQIVATTLALFRERGLAGVSTRDVAQATGMSRSHLYYYFHDWNTLRNAAFDHFAQAELGAAADALAGLSPQRAIVLFLKECLPASRNTAWSLWLDVWHAAMHDAALAQAHATYMRAWEALLAGLIARGCDAGDFRCADPARAARQLFALANGYADDLLLKPSRAAAKAALDEVLQVAALLLRADFR
jgi:AcrR family transcriptional regulator